MSWEITISKMMGHVHQFPIWVCLKMSCTPTPNGFADHYPVFKCLLTMGIYPTFSDNFPICFPLLREKIKQYSQWFIQRARSFYPRKYLVGG